MSLGTNKTRLLDFHHGFEFTAVTTFSLFFFPLYSVPAKRSSNDSGYIGEFEIIDDHRSGKIVIQLNGRLNKTGVISPRFNVQATQIESWVNLLLPARSFGMIILVSSRFGIRGQCSIPGLDYILWYS